MPPRLEADAAELADPPACFTRTRVAHLGQGRSTMTRTRRNRFQSWCSTCGDSVAAGEGHLLGKDASGFWRVHCAVCEGTSSRAWREPPRYAPLPPHSPFVAPCLQTLGLRPS